ncbi:outer membrane protein assembly factor BamE domain-containing protein [Pseudomonas sp. Marseille-QA0892]
MKVWFHMLAVTVSTMDASYAATLQRCTAHDGHVTYTAHGCPANDEQSTITATNARPGGREVITMAPIAAPPLPSPPTATDDLVVVGSQDDGCGNRVTGASRREAIIKNDIRAGMTRRDVESMLGRPDTITGQNGQLRYHYRDRQGNRRQVSFDGDGCVRK